MNLDTVQRYAPWVAAVIGTVYLIGFLYVFFANDSDADVRERTDSVMRAGILAPVYAFWGTFFGAIFYATGAYVGISIIAVLCVIGFVGHAIPSVPNPGWAQNQLNQASLMASIARFFRRRS